MNSAYPEQIQYISRPQPAPQQAVNVLDLPFAGNVVGSYRAQTRINRKEQQEFAYHLDFSAFLPDLSLQTPTSQAAFFLHEQLKQQCEEFSKHEEILSQVSSYYVPADSCVSDFIFRHRAIPQILLNAISVLKESFGKEIVFKLKAPIDTEGTSTLYAVAMWPGSVTDARTALAIFDEWWIPRSHESGGYLAFTYELV